MGKGIPKKAFDPATGLFLTPGEPTFCYGNGEYFYECCCDECDYFLLCYPELDPNHKEEEPIELPIPINKAVDHFFNFDRLPRLICTKK